MKNKLVKSSLMAGVLATTLLVTPFNATYASGEKPEEKNDQSTEQVEDSKAPKTSSENKSNEDSVEIDIDTPASVTGQKVDGTGTVTDFSTSGSKAFYTIADSEQNIFYLIIDMDKTENNVYFLSEIKKSDLSEQPVEGGTDLTAPVQPLDEQVASAQAEAPEAPEESGNGGFLITVLILAGVGLAAYYFLVMKKRHEKNGKEDGEGEMQEDYDDDFLEDEQADQGVR